MSRKGNPPDLYLFASKHFLTEDLQERPQSLKLTNVALVKL